MSNLFDSLQDNAFDVTTNTMGYPATWQPAEGGPVLTAKVHYKDNTEKYALGAMQFMPEKWMVQYRSPFFPDLKESVDANEIEILVITLPGGDTEFFVRRVDTEFDGKTYNAYLELKL